MVSCFAVTTCQKSVLRRKTSISLTAGGIAVRGIANECICRLLLHFHTLQIASTLPHFEIASTLPHFADCSTVQCLHINTLQIALPCSMPRRSHSSLRAPPVAQVLGMVFSSSDFNAFLETVTVLALNTTTTLMPGLLGGKLIGNAGRRFWNTDHCFLITLCQVQVYIEKDNKCAIKSMWCWKLEVAAEYLQVYCFTRVVG